MAKIDKVKSIAVTFESGKSILLECEAIKNFCKQFDFMELDEE